jgi:C-methyltransferase
LNPGLTRSRHASSAATTRRARRSGADAVLIGRLSAYGIAAGGEEGAYQVLDMLRQEIETVLVLLVAGHHRHRPVGRRVGALTGSADQRRRVGRSSIARGPSEGSVMAETGQKPGALVWALANAGFAARCLHVVAELAVADRIDVAPVPVGELAAGCGVDVDALDRVLRLLAVHGVFARHADGYSHTPASRLLRGDAAATMRPYARMAGLPLWWNSLAALERSVRSGRPALEIVDTEGLWPYLRQRPDEAAIFDRAMTAKAVAAVTGVLAVYDFGRFTSLVDVGGGRGHLLRAVLDAVPSATGVLFDLPEMVASVELGHPRMHAVAGDFFVDPLPEADAYLLMDIVHDWPDEECVAILRAVRRAAPAEATLLVVEAIVPDGPIDARTATLDVIMMTLTGGRERTPDELRVLLARAGFSLERVLDTPGPVRIAEAR